MSASNPANLFLVGSPLQLVHALEARHHFALGCRDCALAVVERSGGESLRQLRALVDEGAWRAVHWASAAGGILRGVRARRRLRVFSRGGVRRIFFGYYRSIGMRSVIDRVRPEEVVLLDDGLATISVPRWQAGVGDPEAESPRSLLRPLLRRLARTSLAPIPGLTYFTIFPLDGVVPPERVVRHGYARLRAERARRGRPQRGAETWFLGAPLVERGVLSREAHLKELARAFDGREVTYIPHRGESRAGVAAIQSHSGAHVHALGEPVELVLNRAPVLPARVESFYSSAIATLAALFDDELELRAHGLPADILPERLRGTIAACTVHLRECLAARA